MTTILPLRRRFLAAVALAVWGLLSLAGTARTVAGEPPSAADLRSYRRIAEAHYENGDFQAAAELFQRCCDLAPDSVADRFNLALVLARARRHAESLALLARVEKLDPDLLNVPYLRGIIHTRDERFDEAAPHLARVARADPQCWATQYHLGVCYKGLQQYERAEAAFAAAARIDPAHPNAFYQLMILARRRGQADAAKRYAEQFGPLNAAKDASEKTPEALERSRYTRIIRPAAETPLPKPPSAVAQRFRRDPAAGLPGGPVSPPPPRWTAARVRRAEYQAKAIRTRYAAATGGAVRLADYDADGDLDVYLVRCGQTPEESGNVLLTNQGDRRFTDVTDEAGVGDRGLGMDAVWGDVDNDGHLDLYVVNCGPNVLDRNRGDRKFEDVSAAARVDEPQFGRTAALLDYDHDNDLDLLVVNDVEFSEPPEAEDFRVPEDCLGQVNTLLRNNGNGTFTDQTDEAGLLVDCQQSRCLVAGDFDGDVDIDAFVGNADGESLLFANQRLGKFRPLTRFSPPLAGGVQGAVVGDFGRDGTAGLIVAARDGLWRYERRGEPGGEVRYEGTSIPMPVNCRDAGIGRLRAVDGNNDGWLDLLLVSSDGRRLALLDGGADGGFRDATEQAGLAGDWGGIAGLDTGDLDGDGREDIALATRDRGLQLLWNEGAAETHWLSVQLQGKKVNRSGIGATVEIAGNGHYQRQSAERGWVHFGLGGLAQIDIVRVTWPNGVAQNVIRPSRDAVLKVEEEVRVSASCGMLWAFNGSEFEFINEVLGVGALGVPIEPGRYHQPDCTELTKIEAPQLAACNGVYELRLTEELREITYADRFALRAVDHPAGLEIVPNEMFTAPPFPEDKFFAVENPRPPLAAADEHGADVLELVRHRDGRWPAFPATAHEGLAEPHSLVLEFGDLSGAQPLTLYLDGWIYWPESSTVTAIAQDPRFSIQPVALQIEHPAGVWKTVVHAVGLPTSKGAVVPVDLNGLWPPGAKRLRLTTNRCLYLDRVFVATEDRADRCRVCELPVGSADLRYRGFSRMTRDAFGFERFDYRDVRPAGPWNPPAGTFTRYGDVTPLLTAADDRFAIFGPGDELVLRFDAQRLPPLPPDWVRDYIFLACGWVKDGDLNTASSDRVEPLPFRGMSGYPYPAASRPAPPPRGRDFADYHTRRAIATVSDLDPVSD